MDRIASVTVPLRILPVVQVIASYHADDVSDTPVATMVLGQVYRVRRGVTVRRLGDATLAD